MGSLRKSRCSLAASTGLGILGLTMLVASPAVAQTDTSAPPAPTTSSAASAATSAAPAATGILGKCTSCLGSIKGGLGGCCKSCCGTPLGQLINGAFQPLKMATGGVIPTPCPGPNDPSKGGAAAGGGASGDAPGAQAAADAIKKDQAQAKARAAAVRYLGTVPCHYYPEAEAALIQSLRTDRSECVRWEAAHALAQGCCCTKKTIEALKLVVSGSQKDGNPSEKSFRVKVEALNALEHCLAMCGDPQPQRPESPAHIPQPETVPTPLPQPKRPEAPMSQAGDNASQVRQVNYYEEIEKQSTESLLADARQLVAASKRSTDVPDAPRRGKSLLELWRRSDRSIDPAPDPATDLAAPAPSGEPTLAATAPPSPAVDVASRAGMPATPPAGPYPSSAANPRYSQPAQSPYPPYQPLPYASDRQAQSGAVGVSRPVATPYTAPSGYSQNSPATVSNFPAFQPLPPLGASPSAPAPAPAAPSLTAPTAPGEIATAIGQQPYLYPSTNVPASPYAQPPHVAQQPEWLNSQPRTW